MKSNKQPPKPKASDYQAGYVPPPPHDPNRNDAAACNAEVQRVARNIALAMSNKETPGIVRAHIKAYLSYLFHDDPTEDPDLIRFLFPLHARRTSQIPFVHRSGYIEALTGNDKKKATQAAEEEEDDKPFTPITEHDAIRFFDELLEGQDFDDRVAMGKILITLVQGIGFETNPIRRHTIVDEICQRAFAQSLMYSDEQKEFIEEAIAENMKAGAS